jgi:hypothetical protein
MLGVKRADSFRVAKAREDAGALGLVDAFGVAAAGQRN